MKRIEEMAKDLAKIQCNKKGCEDCEFYQFECDDFQHYTKIAELLYNAGYRKQEQGEWIFNEEKDAFFCSLCDSEALIDASFIGIDFAIAELSDFCPHCGAKMKGGAE